MPNRLADSTSPYLRQHADNPVDWYEWGPEALERARAEDRPILLSVGYSSCHWCHVMAHESFEDEATAAVMNERFINIKVDREERPDIDAIYQRVVQLMGEGGGWPLTVFLTPGQEPFYGGTYFPPQARYGRPSFMQLLEAIDKLYHHDKDRVKQHTQSFREGFSSLAGLVEQEAEQAQDEPAPAEPDALRLAVDRLLSRVDEQWGGFGRQPKFPNPTALELFAAVARRPEDEPVARQARTALTNTLDKMVQGGIYDHLRGGFARYSVDRPWLTPHFEKMLYDNAQLLPLYAETSARHRDRVQWRRMVEQTVAYLVADMRTEQGTFYAATDADSEGVEGKYFCWTPTQVQQVLGDETLARQFCTVYGVSEGGNFEHGWSILNLARPIAKRAQELDLPEAELESRLRQAATTLLEHRYTRIPPHRDDKVLTSWNALLASGLARTAGAMEAQGHQAPDERRPDTLRLAEQCRDLARSCVERLRDDHVDEHGRVLRASFEGRVHTRGYLDDVAYLGRACLDLHELTLETPWLTQAHDLARHAMEHYLRPERDGFYFTADDAEALIDRTESQHDGPIPSGLGVMLELLLRLCAADRAPDGAQAVTDAIQRRFVGAVVQPFGYASLLFAARYAAPSAIHVTIHGPSPQDDGVRTLAARVRRERLLLPDAVSLSFVTADTTQAVVCRQQTCLPPITDVEALTAELSA